MKHFFLFCISCFILSASIKVCGQTATFTVSSDTVFYTVNNSATVTDNITNTTATGGLPLKWHVVAPCDFPADWRGPGPFGICDNAICYQNAGDTTLWNGTVGPIHTSSPYTYNTAQTISLSLNYSSVSLGTHYITIALTDPASSYTKNITFVITKAPAGVSNVNSPEEKVLLYPNPARDEVNVVYDANADVKNIAVYNIIGKVMTVFKVNGDSANLSLENIPSGIYFVRLFNSNGSVVVTRKFTKQ